MELDKKTEAGSGFDNEKNEIDFETGVLDNTSYDKEIEENEVFKKTSDGVDFRTVGWVRASIIFCKSTFPAYRLLGNQL